MTVDHTLNSRSMNLCLPYWKSQESRALESGHPEDKRHSYNWRLTGNHIWPIKWHKYQWPWVRF